VSEVSGSLAARFVGSRKRWTDLAQSTEKEDLSKEVLVCDFRARLGPHHITPIGN
jgi:hypothetical protein